MNQMLIKPGNVTQFTDFLISKIKIDKNKLINAAKKYKKQQNKDNFNNIIKLIENG